MSLLAIIQDVTVDIGLPKPTQVIGSTDQQVLQLLRLANKEGRTLASRYPWEALLKENTFNLTTSADQGDMDGTVVSGGDFEYILNETFWDRTTSLPIPGPLSSTDWQTLQSFPVTGPYFQYRLRGGNLLIDPVPSTTNSSAFEYKSDQWCQSSGGTGQNSWQADTDVGLLSEEIMTQGITWRWLQRKGLEYQQDFDEYERLVANAMMRDGGKSTLRLDAGPTRRVPGVFVPVGNWSPT